MNSLFASRLKELRKELNKTQDDLAAVLEVGRSTIGEYERGKIRPPSEKLFTLANYFSVQVDYLVGNSHRREPPNDSGLDVSEHLAKFVEWTRDKNNAIVFQGEKITDQEREVIATSLENISRLVKSMRKD